MPTIDSLSRAKTLAPGDELAIHSKAIGGTVKVTVAQVAAAVLSAAADDDTGDTTYTASTDAVLITPTAPGSSVWALLELDAPAQALSLILPGDDRAHDQEVLVTCTQAVSTLVVSGGDAAVAGAPAALAAHGFFRLRFDDISSTWYRIG